MSPRATKWTLWLLLYCTAPVPYMLGGVETAPPLRLGLLALVTIFLQWTEGNGGWVWGAFIALSLIQTAFYAGALFALASVVCRPLARLSDRQRRALMIAAVACVVLSTCLYPVYETPMSSAASRSTLLQVLR